MMNMRLQSAGSPACKTADRFLSQTWLHSWLRTEPHDWPHSHHRFFLSQYHLFILKPRRQYHLFILKSFRSSSFFNVFYA
jgi:hypothetical protein